MRPQKDRGTPGGRPLLTPLWRRSSRLAFESNDGLGAPDDVAELAQRVARRLCAQTKRLAGETHVIGISLTPASDWASAGLSTIALRASVGVGCKGEVRDKTEAGRPPRKYVLKFGLPDCTKTALILRGTEGVNYFIPPREFSTKCVPGK